MGGKSSNEYMRIYMLARYVRRREEALQKLGNMCVYCNSNVDLQFDHIDPKTKVYELGLSFASLAQSKLDEEVDKCQLLCADCHLRIKSPRDKGQQNVKGFDVHGTLTSYRYCKCDICKIFKSEYTRTHKKPRLKP